VAVPDWFSRFVVSWELSQSLRRYFHFYNFERPHPAMDYRTPAELYYQGHPAQLLFTERMSLA